MYQTLIKSRIVRTFDKNNFHKMLVELKNKIENIPGGKCLVFKSTNEALRRIINNNPETYWIGLCRQDGQPMAVIAQKGENKTNPNNYDWDTKIEFDIKIYTMPLEQAIDKLWKANTKESVRFQWICRKIFHGLLGNPQTEAECERYLHGCGDDASMKEWDLSKVLGTFTTNTKDYILAHECSLFPILKPYQSISD